MKLFPPQEDLLQTGYLTSEHHYLLNMATGSGKTHMSELAIEKVLASGYKTVYITPLRALARQQYSVWKKKYADYKVGLFTGETIQQSKTKSAYSSSHLLVMTPERFDMCLRNWRTHWNWLPDISLVIVDEFHILGQGQRGARLEGALTRIIRLNPFARIIGLSATMPNAAALSEWLMGKAFQSSWRQISIDKKIERFSSAKDKPPLALKHVKACIDHNGQSIVFCNSRSRVQQLTDYFCAHGIAAISHHAGLLQKTRSENESGFRAGVFKVMVATSTVEMGLNFPARQVVIYDSYSYTDTGFVDLPVWSYIQRMGRAGRPGLDTVGECVLLLPKWAGNADKYLSEDCEAVDSQLANRQAMIEQLLIEVYAGYSRTREELTRGFLPLTFYKQQHPDANINGIINSLVLNELLIETDEDTGEKHPTILKVGLLGRMSVKLMLAPETVTMIRNARRSFQRLYLFDLLLLACMSPDCSPFLQTSYEEMDALCEIVQPLPSALLELTVEWLQKKLPEAPTTIRILSAIKMAAICYCITNSEPTERIADIFDVYESDILMLRESVVRLLTGIGAVSAAIDKSGSTEDALEKDNVCSLTNISEMLANMLRYGIDSRLAALTQLKGVGGATARRLSENGYSSVDLLRQASVDQLSQIDGIGRKLAKSIIEQIEETNGRLPVYTEGEAVVYGRIRKVQTAVDPYRLRRSLELSIKGKDDGRIVITGGREDHIVRMRQGKMVCDCMDHQTHLSDCKHILCVKRSMGDTEIIKMVKRMKENRSHSIREALPSLWYSMKPVEER